MHFRATEAVDGEEAATAPGNQHYVTLYPGTAMGSSMSWSPVLLPSGWSPSQLLSTSFKRLQFGPFPTGTICLKTEEKSQMVAQSLAKSLMLSEPPTPCVKTLC